MPEIEYAFLADAAEVQPGQKFHVLGGGVTRLSGPSIPFQHPHLSLVVGLRLAATERNREHNLEFILTGPDGSPVTASSGRVVAHGPADPNDVILTLAVDLWNLTFASQGEYTVRILVGGSERKRLGLTVAQSREPAAEQKYLA
ncbi:MAG: hypothetical protein ABSA21_09045 [Candidatus Limnocylindrales bacterium]|jgi:hypothetical protein